MAWPSTGTGAKANSAFWTSVKDYIDNLVGDSAATASKLIRRDANGRARVANPAAAQDIATKDYVDTTVAASGAGPAVYFQGRQIAAQAFISGGTVWGAPGIIFDAVGVDFNVEPGGGVLWYITAKSKVFCPAGQGGVYEVSGSITFDLNATGGRAACIRKNGTTPLEGSASQIGASASTYTTVHTKPGFLVTLAAGDYIELVPYQDSGVGLYTAVGTQSTSTLTVRRRY